MAKMLRLYSVVITDESNLVAGVKHYLNPIDARKKMQTFYEGSKILDLSPEYLPTTQKTIRCSDGWTATYVESDIDIESVIDLL